MAEPLGTLKPTAPYAFDTLLDFLSHFAYPTMDLVSDGAYRRVLRVGEALALVEVTSRGTADAPELDVALLAHEGEIDSQALLAQLAHVLAIDEDRAGFFEQVAQFPALGQVIEPVYGLPVLRAPTLFEALTDVIIEQQIMWKTAQRAQQWLIGWGGRSLVHDGRTYFAYPTPTVLAAAAVDDLKPLKITFKRMQLMIDIARQVATESLDLEGLRHLNDDERYRALTAIKGIGHWTASVALGRAYGHSVFITDNDVALQAAVNYYFYGQERRATPQMVTETFAPLNGHAGQAAFYTIARWVLDRY